MTAGLQDQFMQILLTQLRYQDPMAPMQEKDFFAQMAQFTAATEIESLNEKMDQMLAGMAQAQASQNLLAAAKLIGNMFEAASPKGLIHGVVDSVAMSGGKVVVRSGDTLVPVENLVAIGGIADAGQGS
jgi:flagellar basal-body rod modification protein FlgD